MASRARSSLVRAQRSAVCVCVLAFVIGRVLEATEVDVLNPAHAAIAEEDEQPHGA